MPFHPASPARRRRRVRSTLTSSPSRRSGRTAPCWQRPRRGASFRNDDRLVVDGRPGLTEPMSQSAKPTSTSRTRSFRERRRRGVRMVHIRIKEAEIEALERLVSRTSNPACAKTPPLFRRPWRRWSRTPRGCSWEYVRAHWEHVCRSLKPVPRAGQLRSRPARTCNFPVGLSQSDAAEFLAVKGWRPLAAEEYESTVAG